MLLVVTALKLITETALMVLLGQWLLGVLAGARRDGNLAYQLLQIAGRPFVALARLVSPGDANALAAGMSAALTRRRESLEMAVRAQRRAISGYTHEQMIERTLDAYRTTLDRRGWRSGT